MVAAGSVGPCCGTLNTAGRLQGDAFKMASISDNVGATRGSVGQDRLTEDPRGWCTARKTQALVLVRCFRPSLRELTQQPIGQGRWRTHGLVYGWTSSRVCESV